MVDEVTAATRLRALATGRIRAFITEGLPFVLVATAYLMFASLQIELLGVYMDTVDPDYFVVRVLNWNGYPIPAWLQPGNYLFDHIVILMQLYYGTQQAWLGLPLFWLFGTTVVGLRVTHMMFALGVLAALYAMLRVTTGSRFWSAGACLALAVDPVFVYAFRTQSYITMFPSAWLVLSVLATTRVEAATARAARHLMFGCGFLLGFAIYGYFVYAFYAAAIAVAAGLAARARSDRGDGVSWRQLMVAWCCGLALGVVFYILGYILMAHALGGVGKLIHYIATVGNQLGAFESGSPYGDRLTHVIAMTKAVFNNAFHHELMFGESVPMTAAPLKIAILLGLPPAIWVFLEFRRKGRGPLRLLLALQASFVGGAVFFGGRLWAHHYMSLVPLAYAALAIAFAGLANEYEKVPIRYAFGTLVFALVCVNLGGEVLESRTLARTHGVGLYSDAINRFAGDVARDPTTVVFMPDWGLMMPVAFLTAARVELTDNENLDLARTRLCQGRDVAVAIITGDRAARIYRWQRELAGLVPEIEDYRQADGNTVFQVARFRAAAATTACRDGGLRATIR